MAIQAMVWSTGASVWQESIVQWLLCHFRQDVARHTFTAMTTIIFLVLAGLAIWGVLATVLRLDTDGYGRPEIRDRNRHVENLPARQV
jgi:hypothetical protein